MPPSWRRSCRAARSRPWSAASSVCARSPDRAGAGQGQPLPASDRPPRRRLPPARQPGGVRRHRRRAAVPRRADTLSLRVDGAVRRGAGRRTRQSGAACGAGTGGRGRRAARARSWCWTSTCRWRPASAAARPMRRRRCGCCAGCGTCGLTRARWHGWRWAGRRRAGLPRRSRTPHGRASANVWTRRRRLPACGIVLVNPGVAGGNRRCVPRAPRRLVVAGGIAGRLAGCRGDGGRPAATAQRPGAGRRSRCSR